MDRMEFHKKLQILRKQKGLTQEKLAEALFVSRTAVSKWDSGKGYPGIDSLKRLAEFYAVTVDDLLSGEEVLTIAKEEQARTAGLRRDLVFGFSDLSTLLCFFLPLFAQSTAVGVRAVSLLGLTEIALYLRIAYFAVVCGLAGMGILTLALQNWSNRIWQTWKGRVSLWGSAAGMLLFVLGLHPYAASFLFCFWTIKVILLLPKR